MSAEASIQASRGDRIARADGGPRRTSPLRAFVARHEKSLLVLAILCVVFPWYYIIGLKTARLPREALATIETAVDRSFPFHPAWILAYSFVYMFCFLPLCSVRCNRLFRRLALGYAAVLTLCFVGFTLYPVRMVRPPFEPAGFLAWGTRLNHHWDPPVNCFPSLHVGVAYIAALGIWRIDRFAGALAYLGATTIGFSTLGVKQHWVADVVGGFAIAHVAYYFIIRPYDPAPLREADVRLPRTRYAPFFAVYAAIIAVLFFVYRSGFKPWEHSPGL
jgi:membrane-associated phospholipid phosphatase